MVDHTPILSQTNCTNDFRSLFNCVLKPSYFGLQFINKTRPIDDKNWCWYILSLSSGYFCMVGKNKKIKIQFQNYCCHNRMPHTAFLLVDRSCSLISFFINHLRIEENKLTQSGHVILPYIWYNQSSCAQKSEGTEKCNADSVRDTIKLHTESPSCKTGVLYPILW